MQHSPYEIKDKLLQALDHEYNVVDMAAVMEVIAALEKACITKEALEKTRIGRYINELRKRTTNEQLARRAKELVKSWRKLLPQSTQRLNGEEILNHSIASSPGSVTVLGPGPGPGFGPGPGPGNKMSKSISVPGTPRYKTSSPSLMGERSSSPYFSSASNSPLLNSVHQGTSLPSNYAPVKFTQCHVTSYGEKANCVSKSLLNISNQSKSVTSSQHLKPNSPSLTLKQAANTLSSGSSVLPSQRTCSPNVSPGLKTTSSSSSTSLSVNMCSQNVSPTLSHSVAHSTLDIAKTNAANKRLRKENNVCSSSKEQIHCNSKSKIGNGMTESNESILSSETFKKNYLFNSDSNHESDEIQLVTSLKTPKRKRSFEKNELHDNRLGDMIASLPSGSKLPKVKTTQQLIADLQAKKVGSTVSPDNFPSVDTLHSSDAEISRSKSDLLKKFLNAQPAKLENNRDSPIDESSIAIINDYGSHSVPDNSSVIYKNLDVTSNSNSHPDPVDEEINRILSALPPINHAEINLEDDEPVINRPTSVTSDDLNRLSEPWEYVNGVYDCNGTWRPWQECCEQKSLGESFLLLPYVNID